jgi:hypothetical protein
MVGSDCTCVVPAADSAERSSYELLFAFGIVLLCIALL